jgi:hypothetical protein
MKWKNKNPEFFIYLIITYLLILAFKGFNYASNDVVDVMSYARYLQDNTLFNGDFYVTHIAGTIPNERYVFSELLSFLGGSLKWMPFVLHFFATLVFLAGLYRIFSLYLISKPLRWISILILLGPLYKFNLGGNELFYNMFIASYVAKVFGVFAVYYFLKNRYFNSFLLIIFSTLLHPTVGAQLFIIFIAARIVNYLSGDIDKNRKKTMIGIVLYIILAGIYLVVLLKDVNNPGVSNNEYFEIFEFRNAHHFFPQYFPLKSYYIEMVLYVVGIYFMIIYKMENLLKLSLVIVLGIFVYLAGAFLFKMPLILSTQWFKATIWLELFSLIAVMKYFEKEFSLFKTSMFNKWTLTFLNIIVVIIWIMVISGFSYFDQKPYGLVYGMNLSPEEDIAVKAKKITDKNSVFVYPMGFTGFKYYSERSAYIDFKSVVHRRDALREWYDRIEEIYGVDIGNRRAGEDIFKKADENFKRIDKEKLSELKEEGIDYIVQFKEVTMDLPVVIENNKYKVYKIN